MPLPVPKNVSDLYQAHVAIETELSTFTVPRFLGHRVLSFICNNVAAWVAFPFLRVTKLTEEDVPPKDTVYRADFYLFGMRTHWFCFKPFFAYILGKTLMQVRLLFNNPGSYPLLFETGVYYVPRWAMSTLMRRLSAVCNEHEDYITQVRTQIEQERNKLNGQLA